MVFSSIIPGWESHRFILVVPGLVQLGVIVLAASKPFIRVPASLYLRLSWFYRAYFEYPCARRLMDILGVPQWFLGSPYFKNTW